MADRVVTVIPARKTFARASETNVLRVAAYARVSTDSDEQMGSVAAQKDYFEKLIQKNPEWVLVEIYADEGISGTSLNRREAFNRMIADALAGKIDLIITKSLSRFARNTVDTLNTIRKLKIEGVGVYFEKEDINTLDSKGEFLITLMSSLAEEESRSISENVKWGHRKRFADGKYYVAYKNFLGYNKGFVVDENQAKIIRLIYRSFLCGISPAAIARRLTETGIPSPAGCPVWQHSTIESILQNEKYYGAALMQKSFCVDFRTKKQQPNKGELPQYYVENAHEPIVSKEIYNEVQRRLFKTRRANCSTTTFANLLLCHDCGGFLMALPAHSTTYNDNMWRCANRHIRNSACSTPYLYEELLITIFRKITLSLLEINPGIVRECVTALKAVSSTPTAFKKSKIIDTVATCVSGSEAEKNLWRTIMRKVVVHPEHFLEFHIMDGTILPYQMFRISPRICRLSKPAQEQLRQAYAQGESITEIAQRLSIPENTVATLIHRACGPRQPRTTI